MTSEAPKPATDPAAIPTSVPEGVTPASGLRDYIRQVLINEGYRPEVDRDGDLEVKVQGHKLYVWCLDTRPPLVRVFGQWIIEDDVPGDHYTWLRAANAVTGALNLVKAIILEDRLMIAADIVMSPGLDIASVLDACLDVVVDSVRTWNDTVIAILDGHV